MKKYIVIILSTFLLFISCSSKKNLKNWEETVGGKTFVHEIGLKIYFDSKANPTLYSDSGAIDNKIFNLIKLKYKESPKSNRGIYTITIPFVTSINIGFEVSGNSLYSSVNFVSPFENIVNSIKGNDGINWNNLYYIGDIEN